jgi:putative two-component system response regulator
MTMPTPYTAPATVRVPILVVDDDAIVRGLLNKVLTESGYEVLLATDGREAIEILKTRRIHLVITDWMMPEVSGPELCQWIRARSSCRYVFILMLTSVDEEPRVVEALAAGADEFIVKPIRQNELRARLGSAQRLLGLLSRDVTIFSLAQLADSRDPETGDHLDRIREYARLLTQSLLASGTAGDVPADFADLMYMTSPMHDIGKVGIPDSILLKPGQLSNAEFEVMKMHTTIGAATLDSALTQFPEMLYLRTARDVALAHHERFNGTGYPNGLKEDAIPLAGRIAALCDAYDAITSKRVYKASKPHHVARAEIVRASGSQFDPRIVEAFLKVETAFAAQQQEQAVEGNSEGKGEGAS